MKKYLIIAALIAAPAFAASKAGPDWLSIKDRPAKDVAMDAGRNPVETLRFLGIKKGDAALDYEAGGGYYSRIMARAVGPKGSVTAWQASQFVADPKGKKALDDLLASAPNIKPLVQSFDGFAAPANSYSFALMHLVYHDAYWQSEQYKVPKQDPNLLVQKLYVAMKPGGIVGVIDHVGAKGDTREIVEKLHRIDPDVVKADFLRAGFTLAAESPHLHVAGDDLTKNVFDPAIRGKTDRFVFKFMKPRK
jgi:predicted methyltransferase